MSEHQLNWNALSSKNFLEDMQGEAIKQLNQLLESTGTIPLTECMLFRERGGQQFIQELDRRQGNEDYPQNMRGRFKIRVLIHADGSEPEPGDIFKWVHSTKNTFIDKEGKRRAMNTREAAAMLKRSRQEGDQWDIRNWRKFTLDEECCFECGFFDAMAVLTNMSNLSIYPETNAEGNVFYWLTEEVPTNFVQPKPVKPKRIKSTVPVVPSTESVLA